ncbi:MAG TPA: class II fructose-bisphosphate aldolase [Nitrospiria bacterium]|nr:class II fructose-bisphosphate aldolase [Nitrospiria bacterium]
MRFRTMSELGDALKGAIELSNGTARVLDPAKTREKLIDPLVETAVFHEKPDMRGTARWIIKMAAMQMGIHPSSIQELYDAIGAGKCGGFTVPAINVRGMAYDTARAIMRAAIKNQVGAFILEIAKSEMGYTYQTPSEYVAVMLAAAIKEGFQGPIFIQGDHFQANFKKFRENPQKEVDGLRKLIKEAITAGFFNIDIDSSTLVDLDRPNVVEQQRDNFEVAADLTAYVRSLQPKGVTISVGGEIGEVGGKNSTVEEFRVFIDNYNETLKRKDRGMKGISKISVQTGTSHGGVVLPDGSIAAVKLDLEALAALSRVARDTYRLAGAVQHGASTLPSNAFGNFPRIETAEIHLATNFQNIIFDHARLPEDLRARIKAWLAENAQSERKAGDSEEQFYYKARKKAIGPFKRDLWSLPDEVRSAIAADLESTFAFLFAQLNVNGTAELVRRTIDAPLQHHAALKPALMAAADDPDAGE